MIAQVQNEAQNAGAAMAVPMVKRPSDRAMESVENMANQNPLVVSILDGSVLLTPRTGDRPFASGKKGYHGNGKVQGPDPDDPSGKRAAVFQVSLNVVRIDK